MPAWARQILDEQRDIRKMLDTQPAPRPATAPRLAPRPGDEQPIAKGGEGTPESAARKIAATVCKREDATIEDGLAFFGAQLDAVGRNASRLPLELQPLHKAFVEAMGDINAPASFGPSMVPAPPAMPAPAG